ncbi:ABC transporter ATP-binding protein [Vagococcus jeotgali]|uniref:ABC transporter ATP-binding protein n=1 Tax=Vagococcus jeotgali TaxID=3109030 RepID=UPI002DD7B574|nr:ABC transporter ATP-binding protein [Vagococcus sp. B2T-5]
MSILEVKHLNKSFDSQPILEDVSFSINKGDIVGLIGENGAGKTTLMKLIIGLLKIDSGQITVCNELVTYGHNKTNQFIGYLPDVPEFYDYMTAREYLVFCGGIAVSSESDINKRVDELLVLVGLNDSNQKIKSFSRGMKQRLGVAQALFNRPKLLICDEPTSALDPIGRQDILSILESVKQETTIIFSTHIISDIEKICDRFIILHNHEIKLDLSRSDFLKTYRSQTIEIIFSKESFHLIGELCELFPFKKGKTNYHIELVTDDIYQMQQELFQYFVKKDVFSDSISVYEAHLEDVLIEVIR